MRNSKIHLDEMKLSYLHDGIHVTCTFLTGKSSRRKEQPQIVARARHSGEGARWTHQYGAGLFSLSLFAGPTSLSTFHLMLPIFFILISDHQHAIRRDVKHEVNGIQHVPSMAAYRPRTICSMDHNKRTYAKDSLTTKVRRISPAIWHRGPHRMLLYLQAIQVASNAL